MNWRSLRSALAGTLVEVGGALLSEVYPVSCVLCGRRAGEGGFPGPGARVSGLRPWDTPQLCRRCGEQLFAGGPALGLLSGAGEGGCVVGAGGITGHALVKVVGQCKYHGLRGLAWPLAAGLMPIFQILIREVGPVDALVPVPLHPRRRRSRGFNQAEVLARLVSWAAPEKIPVVGKGMVRIRATGQQAKIRDDYRRARNVAGAFRAVAPDGGRCRVGLVDDLVTSGATVLALAGALRQAGWDVVWALACGLAAGHRAAVDTGSRRIYHCASNDAVPPSGDEQIPGMQTGG